jgi:biopolymer transport protein TolQ
LPTSPSNVIILEDMKNYILLSLIQQTEVAEPAGMNVWGLVMEAGWVVKLVMILLVVASVLSWTIIFWKWKMLKSVVAENKKFSDSFWSAGSLDAAQRMAKTHTAAPMTRVFESGLHEFNQVSALGLERSQACELLESNVTRSLEKTISQESERMQKHMQFLATTASAGPFIGLFGTVWGIMTAFINIGATGASNLAVVAPGIAEALIATALGLFAAIPAAIFFNFFIGQIKEIANGMKHFAMDFMNTAKRSL